MTVATARGTGKNLFAENYELISNNNFTVFVTLLIILHILSVIIISQYFTLEVAFVVSNFSIAIAIFVERIIIQLVSSPYRLAHLTQVLVSICSIPLYISTTYCPVPHFYFVTAIPTLLFILSVPLPRASQRQYAISCALMVLAAAFARETASNERTETLLFSLSYIFGMLQENMTNREFAIGYAQQQRMSAEITHKLEAAFAFGIRKLPRPCFAQFLTSNPGKTLSTQNVAILFLRLKTTTRHGTMLFSDYHSYVYLLDYCTLCCGVEKIKSTGSDYIVVAGLEFDEVKRRCHKSHAAIAKSIAKLIAFAHQAAMIAERAPYNACISAGMVFGPVFSSVLGLHRLEFDVWGTSVNHAARLLSCARPSEMLISRSVKPFLPREMPPPRKLQKKLKGIAETIFYSVPISLSFEGFETQFMRRHSFSGLVSRSPQATRTDVTSRWRGTGSQTPSPYRTPRVLSTSPCETRVSFAAAALTWPDEKPPSTVYPPPGGASSFDTAPSSEALVSASHSFGEKTLPSPLQNIHEYFKLLQHDDNGSPRAAPDVMPPSTEDFTEIFMPHFEDIVLLVGGNTVPLAAIRGKGNPFNLSEIFLSLALFHEILAKTLHFPNGQEADAEQRGAPDPACTEPTEEFGSSAFFEVSDETMDSSGSWCSSAGKFSVSSVSTILDDSENNFLSLFVDQSASLYCPREQSNTSLPPFLEESLPNYSQSAYNAMTSFFKESSQLINRLPERGHSGSVSCLHTPFDRVWFLWRIVISAYKFSGTALNQALFVGQLRDQHGRRMVLLPLRLFFSAVTTFLCPRGVPFMLGGWDASRVFTAVPFLHPVLLLLHEVYTTKFMCRIDRIALGNSRRAKVPTFPFFFRRVIEFFVYNLILFIQITPFCADAMWRLPAELTGQLAVGAEVKEHYAYQVSAALQYYIAVLFSTSPRAVPMSRNTVLLCTFVATLLFFIWLSARQRCALLVYYFAISFAILVVRAAKMIHRGLLLHMLWIKWFYSVIMAKLLVGFLPKKAVLQLFHSRAPPPDAGDGCAGCTQCKGDVELFPLPLNTLLGPEGRKFAESILVTWNTTSRLGSSAKVLAPPPASRLQRGAATPKKFNVLHGFDSLILSFKKSFANTWHLKREKARRVQQPQASLFTRVAVSFFVLPVPLVISEDAPFSDSTCFVLSQQQRALDEYKKSTRNMPCLSHFFTPFPFFKRDVSHPRSKFSRDSQCALMDFYPMAACVQVDIVGFTSFSSQNKLKDVGTVIFMLFSLFDKIVEKEPLATKVKTLGDGYQVLVGEPFPSCPQTLEAAICYTSAAALLVLRMIHESVKLFKGLGYPQLALSAGLSVSPIFAELIGFIRCTMDTFGSAVDEAALLEGFAPRNCLLVSSSAYALLRCTPMFCFSEHIVFVRPKCSGESVEKVTVNLGYYAPDGARAVSGVGRLTHAWLVSCTHVPRELANDYRAQLDCAIMGFLR
eukprot:gnl/Chilomastix_cuspidata/994.p1 GENE.gnl/Chilomastix_cuspidata/994~~gnl/Chilomastix_cuspidata/994.p1  ORF type:complete len:1459 (-),score=291.60 gnl/Chilomastix_cuspidata/994:246-4622(-)